MGEACLNGRVPLAWEVAAVERGRACERDRDLAVLAGVLAEEFGEHVPRPVTDIVWEFS